MLGQEESLEREIATHSSSLAWEIPWTEESSGIQSMGPQSQTQLRNNTHFRWHLTWIAASCRGLERPLEKKVRRNYRDWLSCDLI